MLNPSIHPSILSSYSIPVLSLSLSSDRVQQATGRLGNASLSVKSAYLQLIGMVDTFSRLSKSSDPVSQVAKAVHDSLKEL